MNNTDILKNLQALFDTKQFYKIIADKNGRTVLYGTLSDSREIRTGETLETAFDFICSVKPRIGYDPILIYPMGYDHTQDMPFCAIDRRNSLSSGIWFFEKGYYLTDDVHPLAEEILKAYLCELDTEPEKVNFGRLDDSYETPYMTNYQKYLECVLGTRNYYAITDFFIAKSENGELRAKPMDVCPSYNLELILKDQAKEDTYYPIVIFRVLDNYHAIEPAFLIHNDDFDPFIMEFIKGYYKTPADKNLTIEQLISKIHDMEILAFTRPQSPTIKVECYEGTIEKPNPRYIKIPV
jgi:hypothetical protein